MTNPTITIKWNANDETKIAYNPQYRDAYGMLRIDMLGDALAELEAKYLDALKAEFFAFGEAGAALAANLGHGEGHHQMMLREIEENKEVAND